MIGRILGRMRALRYELVALYLACRDQRTPLHAKVVAGVVLAYALSPVDLVPDFIPVLGYLDDFILLPAGIWLSMRLIPVDVMADARVRAISFGRLPRSVWGAALVVLLWVIVATLLLVWLITRVFG